MNQLNLALITIGAVVLTLGMLTRVINRSYLSMPLLAFIVGVVLGPIGTSILTPDLWGDSNKLLEECARVTIGISLMAIALRIPRNYLFDHKKSFFLLLGAGMPAMFFLSSLMAHWILGVPLLIALLIGAAICPTDPVVASSIVTGGLARKHLPDRFRYGLSTESAINDGLAYPLVLLPILLLTPAEHSPWLTWGLRVVLWEIGGAIVLGALLGWIVGKSLLLAEHKKTLDHSAFLATTLALTLLTLGVAKFLSTDSVLAVFVAGMVFSQLVGGSDRAKEDKVQETVNLFFTLPIFIFLGLMLPIDSWFELGWDGVWFALAILLVRRIPVIIALSTFLPIWNNWKLALLAGHFGPIGISALFYGMVILDKSGHDIAWTAGSLVITASLIVHGVTAAPLAKLWAVKKEDKE
ncbi:MAG: sodium:proton antiporter [Rickettsiales bacterium]|uniref:Sodium/hydrogen exchanger n=1 Tax=Alteromonas naphthalenivorans TaxID=715451 RepID=F5Z9U2_ALTNA|nr:sodium:proton antiporter [Alteromonas naphthalenivorans]AEF02097.1 sodium/hydrogen exchanger [Alteromonas naphthalenivorans]MBB66528.1 sodium:proton antiporter [Rickettsiales bacterium]